MDANIKKQVDIINQRIKELNALYHYAANKADISDGELCIWSVLLNGDEEYSQQDLCEKLSLTKQTVNSSISNLIKKGYVFLEHVPGTRNRKVIRITEDGLSYGKSTIKWIFDAEQKALDETDSKEVQVCIAMLEKYIQNLKRAFNEKDF